MAIENINEKRNKIDGTVFQSKTITVDGRVYKIVEDDTNFGTTDTIKPYKVYTALLTQSSTGIPAEMVLENTLGGAVTFTRDDAGQYSIVSDELFTANKTGCIVGSDNAFGDDTTDINTIWADSSTISLYTLNSSNELTDGVLLKTLIEIRVYN